MQPRLSSRRPIEHPLRPDRPLDHRRLSDPILVRRAKDGDRDALAELCERHAPRVERLARHLLEDPEDARDAVQEALAKLCVRIRQFRGESQFSTWLHRLVVNTCRDVAQRQHVGRCEPLRDDARPAPDADPSRAADQAMIVVLKDALGFSFEEIAAERGMPVGTAKCYAHRGRNHLRTALETVNRHVA